MRYSIKDRSTFNASGSLSLSVNRLTRIMQVLCCVFLCLFVVFHRVLCKDTSDIWSQHKRTDVTYGTSTPLEGAQSTFQCLLTCSATEGCKYVNVKPDNFQCELSTHRPAEGGLTVNQRPGWTVYYREISQWVQTVTNVSSGWNANQVIGPPDVYPNYGVYGAWEPRSLDSNKFIEVQFAEAVYITAVEVYETYQGGGVQAINAKDGLGTWTTLWSTATVEVIRTARIFAPELSVAMNSPSRDVRIEVDSTGYRRKIDAVRLMGTK